MHAKIHNGHEYSPVADPTTTDTKEPEGEHWDHDVEGSDTDFPHHSTTEVIKKSQWQSDIFRVKRVSQKSTWKHEQYYKYRIFVTTKWIIVPLFLLFGVGTILVSIFYFIHDLTKYLSFGIILGINIVGGLIGAVMVYRFGTVEDVIDFMTLQNHWYETEMESLTKKREMVKNEAKKIHFGVHKLKQISKDLESHYEQFEDLRKQLEEVCSHNETLQDKLDEVSKICHDTLVAIKMNEKAHLLSIYYDLTTRKGKDVLIRKKDYDRFLGRLTPATRKEFEVQGGFETLDKNNDGFIDVHEFQDLINTVLEITEDQEAVLLNRLKQLNYK